MWANMNALYAAASKCFAQGAFCLCLEPVFLCASVLFIGGIVGATVETIELENDEPHNFGAVTRWMVMYPMVKWGGGGVGRI